MDDGYPKKIARGFEGIPNDVDAAFVWTGNEKIYFFKVSLMKKKLENRKTVHGHFFHFLGL